MKNTPKDTRLGCQFCGVKTWSRDYKAFMADHDRPDGRRCVKAVISHNNKVWGPLWDAYCGHTTPQECSICRRVHGSEIRHEAE